MMGVAMASATVSVDVRLTDIDTVREALYAGLLVVQDAQRRGEVRLSDESLKRLDAALKAVLAGMPDVGTETGRE
jgi:hypothetical protein